MVKLFKPKKPREWDDIAAAFRMRAEEIRDGFLVGYSGSGTDQHLPESLEETLHGLKEIAERFEEAAERVQGPQRDENKVSFDDYRQLIEVRTKEVETLLTANARGFCTPTTPLDFRQDSQRRVQNAPGTPLAW